MMLGLTRAFLEKHNKLVVTLKELGVTTIEQAEGSGVCTDSEVRMLKMVMNHRKHPENDLFNPNNQWRLK